MQYISHRNTYVRINRHLDAHCPGHKLRKTRSRSADAAGSYYLENRDGSIVQNIDLEQLARRLGCLTKYERVGEPPERTGEEAKILVDELAKEIATGRAVKKAIARDVAQFSKFVFRVEN